MKKLFLLPIVVVFVITNFSAQEVKFGAKAGVNFASISGDETDGLDSRTAFHLGLVANIGISENFSVQPELLYSAQGADYSDSDGYNGAFKFDYLNIPIMAKFMVAEGFSLQAGPQIGFLLSAKDDYEEIGGGETGEDDIKDFVKGIDFGLNLGLGYGLANGLFFDARYNLGLSNIWDFDSGDFKNQNSVIQISVGYFF